MLNISEAINLTKQIQSKKFKFLMKKKKKNGVCIFPIPLGTTELSTKKNNGKLIIYFLSTARSNE